MTLAKRRLIYTTFFLVFFITVPLLILYATGYKYNFQNNTLQKTGILIVESLPKKSDVYLNNKKQNQTPARLARLLPNKYSLSVKRTGFHPWNQKIEIKSGLTTFETNIILFKESLPTLAIEGEITILSLSPDQKQLLYAINKSEASEELRILNLESDTDHLIKELNPKTYLRLDFIEWSPDKNKALLKQSLGDFNAYLIVDTTERKTKELFNITRLNFDQLSWDKQNNNLLYGLEKSALHQINLETNNAQVTLSANITNFDVRGNNAYYITKIGQESFLNHRLINNPEDESKKIKLPSPSDFTIEKSPLNFITLLDKKNNDLFIITPDAFEDSDLSDNIVFQANANAIKWTADNSKILYYTEFELWDYDLSQKKATFINRYGTPIEHAIWHPENSHIIYQTNNGVKVTDISTKHAQKNEVILTELQHLDNLILNQDTNQLYFRGSIGNKSGIYQLNLK